MTIKITKGKDINPQQLCCIICGQPNTGKSSLAISGEKVLCLAFDKGIYRAYQRDNKDIVQVTTWADIADIDKKDISGHNIVATDTIGKALDALEASIIAKNPKLAMGGGLSINGYGVLKKQFCEWVARMKGLGVDLVFTAHFREERRGDETVERIAATGSSRDEIYQEADIIGRLTITPSGKRELNFNPTNTNIAKNVGLPTNYLTLSTLPGAIDRILADAKDKIAISTKTTETAQQALARERKEWEAISDKGLDLALSDIAEQLRVSKASPVRRKMLLEVAGARGLQFDRKKRQFVAK